MPQAHSSSPISGPISSRANAAAYASSRTSAVRDALNQASQTQNRTQNQIIRETGQKIGQKSSRPVKVGRNLSAQKRKALIASGAVATLMVAVILPDQVSSEAIAQSNCQEVIQSGAEMSRGEISSLITLPVGSPKQSVRQAISEPYCTLPVETDKAAAAKQATESSLEGDSKLAESNLAEREAYPLAFDPEVWVVLNYESGKYTGYDFVFKP